MYEIGLALELIRLDPAPSASAPCAWLRELFDHPSKRRSGGAHDAPLFATLRLELFIKRGGGRGGISECVHGRAHALRWTYKLLRSTAV